MSSPSLHDEPWYSDPDEPWGGSRRKIERDPDLELERIRQFEIDEAAIARASQES